MLPLGTEGDADKRQLPQDGSSNRLEWWVLCSSLGLDVALQMQEGQEYVK